MSPERNDSMYFPGMICKRYQNVQCLFLMHDTCQAAVECKQHTGNSTGQKSHKYHACQSDNGSGCPDLFYDLPSFRFDCFVAASSVRCTSTELTRQSVDSIHNACALWLPQQGRAYHIDCSVLCCKLLTGPADVKHICNRRSSLHEMLQC